MRRYPTPVESGAMAENVYAIAKIAERQMGIFGAPPEVIDALEEIYGLAEDAAETLRVLAEGSRQH